MAALVLAFLMILSSFTEIGSSSLISNYLTLGVSADTIDTIDTPDTGDITISGEKYPNGELSLGRSYGIDGDIHSKYPISKVYGGVYDSDESERVIYWEEKPNTLEYSLLNGFDPYLTFNELLPGSYVYKILVTDSKGKTAEVVRSEFSVVDNSPLPSAIELTGESIPADTLPTGSMFSVRGLISSSFMLMRVWGGVYDLDGTPTAQYCDFKPGKATYDLNATFDNYLAFNELPAGTYLYKIEARDIRDYSVTLIEKKFTLTDDDTAPSNIELYNYTYPTGTLPLGGGFGVTGAIFSTYTLSKLSGGVYNADGTPTKYASDMDLLPLNRKSFNLLTLDDSIEFNNLPVGDYIYKVEVTDIKGYSKCLVKSSFKIRSTAIDDLSAPIVMKGIDVSSWQQDIDWKKVKASGIDFVILRAAYTSTADANYYIDTYFEKNYKEAREAGLQIGAYIYTSAYNISEIEANIKDLLVTLGGKTFELPIYIDVETESRQTQIGKEALTKIVRRGCDILREAGYQPGVYTSMAWFRKYVDADVLAADGNEIWLATWLNDPETYDYSDFCITWQYASDGKVDGIDGDIDMNWRYKEAAHEWGVPTYKWNGEICTASRSCRFDNSHTEIEMSDAVCKVIKEPTCEEKGVGVYTATFDTPEFETQTATFDIPALGHNWILSGWEWKFYDNAMNKLDIPKAWAELYCLNNNNHKATVAAVVTKTEKEGVIFYTAVAVYEGELFDTTIEYPKDTADEPTPEKTTPDIPTPDIPTPDVPTPDEPTPIVPTPDEPTPVVPTPDEPTPDVQTPDVPTPVVPTPDEPEPAKEIKGILGDVNGDGQVDSADALMILRNSVGLETFDDTQRFLGDVNEDNDNIDSSDALAVLRYSVGMIDIEKIGTPVTM